MGTISIQMMTTAEIKRGNADEEEAPRWGGRSGEEAAAARQERMTELGPECQRWKQCAPPGLSVCCENGAKSIC